MSKVIVITAKHEGYRRCGVAHSTTPTYWHTSNFSEEDLKRLWADPHLKVVAHDDDGEAEGQGAQGTDPAATPETAPEVTPETKPETAPEVTPETPPASKGKGKR